MGIAETIALTMGVAWASGINLYAAILTLGVLGASDAILLPPGLEILTNPAVIAAAGFMYFVEFFTDKLPGLDTGWDAIHTFIRIPAGAVLAAQAVGDVSPAAELVALLLGGGLAAATHATKSGTRMLINTSPEPFTNWGASVTEDVAVVAGLWTALYYPELFVVLGVLFIVLMIWLLPKIWRGIKAVFAKLRSMFGGSAAPGPAREPAAAPAGEDGRFRLALGKQQ